MALFYVMNARKEKVCNAPIRLSDLSDNEIYQMTRFPRAAVNELIELMRDDLQQPTARSYAVTLIGNHQTVLFPMTFKLQ